MIEKVLENDNFFSQRSPTKEKRMFAIPSIKTSLECHLSHTRRKKLRELECCLAWQIRLITPSIPEGIIGSKVSLVLLFDKLLDGVHR